MGLGNAQYSRVVRAGCLGGLAAAGLISLPFWASEHAVGVVLLIFMYLSLAQMWNLLAGYSGLVSLGQQVFIGLGGYSLAILTELYQLPWVIAIGAGGILSVMLALIISQPIFKMRGVFFTIGTWIVAEAVGIFCTNWAYVRYAQGFNIKVSYDLTTTDIYYVAMVTGLASVGLVYGLLRSKLGLALMAMRDNEAAAETMGIELYKTKLQCYLISAFVTGITGGALYLYIAYINPASGFGIDWTISMTFMVIIGGIGTIEGPLVGAVFFVLIKQYLYEYPGISLIILGVIAIVTILVAPKGIMGTLQDKYGWSFLSPRRKAESVVGLKAAGSDLFKRF